jgi:archaellum component FlaC
MKKLFCLFFAVLFICILVLPCYAESTENPDIVIESAEEEVTESEVTLLDRLTEFWNEYTAEILSGGGMVTTLGLIIFLWKKIKPLLLKVLKAGNETADVQDKQSKAINNLIDLLDKIDERMTALEEKINAVNNNNETVTEHFKEVQKSLEDLAKILDTVYSHSKVLSQGTKDLVHTYCADCIKIAEHEINGGAEVSNNVKSD